MKSILNENQQLKDEKIRIMGVNTMLEQKIQIERSEMMSMQSDMDVVMRHGGAESVYSGYPGANRKMGQMSSYIRKQQNAIRSIKGST